MQRQTIDHKTFLNGLRQFINALKRLRQDPSKSAQLNDSLRNVRYAMLNHHLPFGICKGYALSKALAYKAPDIQGFNNYYHRIGLFAQMNASEVQNWILNNQALAQSYASYSEQFLTYHRLHTNYKDMGLGHEVTLTANLKSHQLEDFLITFAIPALKSQNPKKSNEHYGIILIGSGEHKISVNVWRNEDGTDLYRVNDANGNLGVYANTTQLSAIIEARFRELRRYGGECDSYVFDILTTDKPDPVFNSIFNRLQEHVKVIPECIGRETPVDPSKPCLMRNLPYRALLQRLIDNYKKGQSKVGFIEDVLLYFNDEKLRGSREFACPMESELRASLSARKQPRMRAIIERYRDNINLPSRNGYSWLHLAILTNEKYVAWILLKYFQANPALLPIFESQVYSQNVPVKNDLVLRGNGELGPDLRPDQDVEIVEGHFTYSLALHATAIMDDLELWEALIQAGANPMQEAGNGQSAFDLIDPKGQIAKSQPKPPVAAEAIYGNTEFARLFGDYIKYNTQYRNNSYRP